MRIASFGLSQTDLLKPVCLRRSPNRSRSPKASIRTLHGWFPKIGVLFWGVPIIRTIIVLGLYWGPLVLGNYYIPNPTWAAVTEVTRIALP